MRAAFALACLVLLTLSLSPPLEAESTWRSCSGLPTPEKFIQPGKTVVRGTVRQTLAGPECIAMPGAECNLGFMLYTDEPAPGGGTQRRYWATTAGHCFSGGTSMPGWAPRAMDFAYGVWGEVAASIPNLSPYWKDHDIAIIRIYDGYQANVDPSLPFYGGPVGLGDGLREDAIVAHVGRLLGVAGAPETVPRLGSAIDANQTAWRCLCMAANGDSGSPFLDEHGRALGMAWMGYPVQNVSQNTNRIPAPEDALTCEHNPALICSPDPAHPVYQTGPLFRGELAALRATTRNFTGAPVDWRGLQLATAPLTDVGRLVMG